MRQFVITVGLSILAIFAPAQPLFIAATILIIADMVTGIYAAYKTGQLVTSAGIRRTANKLFLYNLSIGAAFLVQHYMMADTIPVSNIVSSTLGLAELKSIIENVDKINGGSIMKSILARLGSVNDTLNKPKNPQDT